MSKRTKKCNDCGNRLNGWGVAYCKECYLKRHPEYLDYLKLKEENPKREENEKV